MRPWRKDTGRKYIWKSKLALKDLNNLKLGESANSKNLDQGQTDEDGVEEETLPCWILDMLPNDVLQKIVRELVLVSGESWVHLSLTCRKFQELCFQDPEPFRTFAQYIYPLQCYDEAAMTLNGVSNISTLEQAFWGDDYRRMLAERPYLKFQGCYISVVNYVRHGSNVEGSSSLINPVHMITYYRYFRFYPDGTCLRLLTTDEPSTVVKTYDRSHNIKDADLCRWSLSLDDDFSLLTVTRTNEKYEFEEKLRIHDHSRKKYQRLKWVSSGAYDHHGERIDFSLRKEKPFSFSRVTSYPQPVKT